MIILGLLKLDPMNGYEIRQAALSTTNLFWAELKYGHIYPALQTLSDQDYIQIFKKQDPEQRKESITYQITEKGNALLNQWIQDPNSMNISKSETLAKLFFSDENNIDTQIEMLTTLLTESKKKLQQLTPKHDHLSEILDSKTESSSNLFFQNIVLEFGIEYFGSMVKLAERNIERLHNLGKKS